MARRLAQAAAKPALRRARKNAPVFYKNNHGVWLTVGKTAPALRGRDASVAPLKKYDGIF
jgi:hypothetical protein